MSATRWMVVLSVASLVLAACPEDDTPAPDVQQDVPTDLGDTADGGDVTPPDVDADASPPDAEVDTTPPDAEVDGEDDAEVVDAEDAEVTDADDAGDAEVTDADDAGDAEVTDAEDVGDAEVADAGDAGDAEVTDADDAGDAEVADGGDGGDAGDAEVTDGGECTVDGDCDDSDLCTTDTCDAGTCVFTPLDCDDGADCTSDSCDPTSGTCVNAEDALPCDDGDPCTTEACATDLSCEITAIPDGGTCEGDGDPCTLGTCDTAGACVNEAVDCGLCPNEPACDPCGDPTVMDMGDTDSGETTDETDDFSVTDCAGTTGTLGAGTADKLYEFTPAYTQQVTLQVTPTAGTTDPAMYVMTSCDDTTSCMISAGPTPDPGPTVTFTADAGVTYYVVVEGGALGEDNTFDMVMTGDESAYCSDGVDNDGDGDQDCEDTDCDADPFCNCSTNSDCDDGSVCTTDSCNSIGECDFVPLVCNDGDPCTADSCDPTSGCQATAIPSCPGGLPYTNDFACGDNTWGTEIIEGTVAWNVDALPDPPAYFSPDCSLNFNDDVSGYDTPAGGPSQAIATSPPIDTTGATEVWLSYVDLFDIGDSVTGSYDLREVRVSTDDFQTFTALPTGHTSTNEGEWSFRVHDLSSFAGQTIQIRFWFDTVDGALNSGLGWFVDDVVVSDTMPDPPAEDCTDGIDNSLDGLVDCADPACVGDAACPEDAFCDDGIDNDGNGDTDCADVACVGDAACPEDANCTDGVDNDGDGDTDCADSDCAADANCACTDDGDCDNGDACSAGTCDTGTGICSFAPLVCDDGFACTTDTCDPDSGCVYTADDAACDDGVDCTVDVCDPAAGCVSTPDDSACGDGDLCTTDTCDAGAGCDNAAITNCPAALPYADDFPCGPTDWTAEILEGDITWAVDALPDPPAYFSADCSLNFNDDIDSYASADGPSRGVMTSPPIDASSATELYLTYMDYFEIGDSATSTTYDQRLIEVSTDGFETFTTFPNGHTSSTEAMWLPRALDLSEFAGETIQIRFEFDTGDDFLNSGVGWFIDDLSLSTTAPVEVCDDTFDNDGDGAADCNDPDCVADPACACTDDADCDDLNDCTDDTCDTGTGECQFDAITCDDGFDCTTDTCDPDSGCEFTPDDALCDDGVDCTVDTCDDASGCVFTPDDLACNDGDPCTSNTCDATAGCTYPAIGGCPAPLPYMTSFDCGTSEFETVILQGDVFWAVDDLPNPPGYFSADCSLNFNDDVDYDSSGGDISEAIATSPAVDASGVSTLYLVYADYWDTNDDPPSTEDLREIRVSDDGFQTYTAYVAGHFGGTENQWTARQIDISAFAGSPSVQVRFWFDTVDSFSNTGVGWFIDDLSIVETPPFEICDDGVDNDLDGDTDCFDPECLSDPACSCTADSDCDDGLPCTANVCDTGTGECTFPPADCDDGVACTTDSCDPATGCVNAPDDLACDDGDLCTTDVCDPTTDCSNTSVAGCPEALPYMTAFDCGTTDWTTAILDGDVPWAVDGLPDPPGYFSADCSLNFNNDVDYDASDGGASEATATSPVFDATGLSELFLSYTDFWETDDGPGSTFPNDDLREVRVSDDGFQTFTAYSAGHTPADEGVWTSRVIDISDFAGGQLQVQFWFDTDDGFANTGVGWFVDDLMVAGTPPVEICDDGADNDGDGATDCADVADCAADPACACTTDADCDDGDACTDNVCDTGTSQCTFPAADCDDGFACTTDSCDPATGCTYETDDAPCDDSVDCTSDACVVGSGCVNTPVHSACDDGDECTSQQCTALGCANDPLPACPAALPYTTPFDCASSDWSTQVDAGTITWNVDGLPDPPGYFSPMCSMNFNDDVGSYASSNSASTGSTTSPPIDTTGATELWLSYVDYFDVSELTYDDRILEISTDGFATSTELDTGHTSADEGTWVARLIDISAFAGQTIQIRFTFDTGDSISNTGDGWFVDDLTVSASVPPEVCGDGLDNDGDGAVDCMDVADCVADPACACADDTDCDDGDACTDDVCDTGTSQCTFSALTCDDGFDCTTDTCDPATGCVYTPDDTACDDGVDCTVDTCDAASGCVYTPDDTACADGDACTTDTCDAVAGCQNPAYPGCPFALPYATAFDCGATDWTTELIEGDVVWAIDGLPDPPGYFSPTCSLNFNDDTASYDSTSGPSQATATSLPIDGSGATTLYLSYVDYWETGDSPTSSWDLREVRVSDDGFATFTAFSAGHTSANEAQWVARVIDISQFAGAAQVQVQFWFDSVDGSANDGVGWFVDDLTVGEAPAAEVCDDGLDNDGDGALDCLDVADCVADPACACADDTDCDDGDACTTDTCDLGTSQCVFAALDCDDGVDCTADSCDSATGCVNAPDDTGCDDGVDCTVDVCDVVAGCANQPANYLCDDGDPCTSQQCTTLGCVNDALPACPAALPYATSFDCGATDWSLVTDSGSVYWHNDGLPDPPASYSPMCSMNFNDDVDSYDSGDVASTGHTTSPPIDATGATEVWLSYVDYFDVAELSFDVREIRVSTDNFGTWANFPTGHTAAEEGQWVYRVVDLSAFAGQTFQVQFFFDTGDGFSNSGDGWFVDDLTVAASAPVEICDDGLDNDQDGAADCMDLTDCVADPACACAGDGDCDDGDPCTDNVCDLGTFQCTYPPADCDDGIDCTDDACDAATGCTHTPNDAACDDLAACTADSCDPSTGCVNAPDHLACDDGDPCTGQQCTVAGCLNPPIAPCPAVLPYATQFDCGSVDWTVEIEAGDVAWNVDALPDPPAYWSPMCSLNFNDDVSSYDSTTGASTAMVTSPPITTALATEVWLSYVDYWQTEDGPTSGYDLREVRVSTNDFATFTAFDPGHDSSNEAVWTARVIDLSAFAGQTIRVQFWFDTTDGSFNDGAGWFVDDLTVSATPPAEICDDTLDNDADGDTDCADVDCTGAPSCP